MLTVLFCAFVISSSWPVTELKAVTNSNKKRNVFLLIINVFAEEKVIRFFIAF